MKAISGVEEFSMLGWCIGAILATVYSALRADDGLRNLILLTAPLDFSNKQGIAFAKWVDERFFDVDKVLANRQHADRDDRLRRAGPEAGGQLCPQLFEALGQSGQSARRRRPEGNEHMGHRQCPARGRRLPPTDSRPLP